MFCRRLINGRDHWETIQLQVPGLPVQRRFAIVFSEISVFKTGNKTSIVKPCFKASLSHFHKIYFLLQHYDKVHNKKIYECQKCFKKFSTTTLQKSHMSYCGREFKCSCGVVYKSNEALLTHAKRKSHPLGPTPR
jgi:hypothetical protein